jgi:hypothetical protein
MGGILKYLKSLMTKQYGIYHTRWQISALVMMPFMIGLEMLGLPLWLNLMVGQFIGALIFWEIDKRIFGQHKKDTLEAKVSQ